MDELLTDTERGALEWLRADQHDRFWAADRGVADERPGRADPLTETLVVLRDALAFLLEQEAGRTSPEALLRAQRLRDELRRVLGSEGDRP